MLIFYIFNSYNSPSDKVAITVLPLNVAYSVLGKWVFGSITCKIWLTADVLCCTASILNLCAIALDRSVVGITSIYICPPPLHSELIFYIS